MRLYDVSFVRSLLDTVGMFDAHLLYHTGNAGDVGHGRRVVRRVHADGLDVDGGESGFINVSKEIGASGIEYGHKTVEATVFGRQ